MIRCKGNGSSCIFSGIQPGMIEKNVWKFRMVCTEHKLDVLVLSVITQNNGNVSFIFRKHAKFKSCMDMNALCSGIDIR
jgi:hypothetical protein